MEAHATQSDPALHWSNSYTYVCMYVVVVQGMNGSCYTWRSDWVHVWKLLHGMFGNTMFVSPHQFTYVSTLGMTIHSCSIYSMYVCMCVCEEDGRVQLALLSPLYSTSVCVCVCAWGGGGSVQLALLSPLYGTRVRITWFIFQHSASLYPLIHHVNHSVYNCVSCMQCNLCMYVFL